MKALLTRDIPPRATLVVLALVLVASIVTGREGRPTMEAKSAAPRESAEQVPHQVKQPDLLIPVRQRNESGATDLFRQQSWARPQPTRHAPIPAVPDLPPPLEAPSAPPLPFRYLGQLEAKERAIVFLVRGDEIFMLAAGDTVENTYKVEAIADSAVDLVYLPLGVKQSLAIPSAP